MDLVQRKQEIPQAQIQHRAAGSKLLLEILKKVLIYGLLTAGVIIFTAPWAWMVSASFQPIGDIFDWPPNWVPENFTLNNYTRFVQTAGLGRLFFNSGYIAIAVTALQLFFN